jgi:cytochrome c oxidase assembly protein subunit 15
MTDWIYFPKTTRALPDALAPVRIWLWLTAALIFAMVLVGGATRLTESGLSITEWKPITGVLPPLTEADWLAEFEKYKKIPQYSQMFPDMELARFKTIFFWEWSHRLLGRVIGLVFALPLAFFWLRGVLDRGLKLRLLGVLALGALQGAVGWWMVASGLVHRTEVAQERLAIHLLLASVTLAAIIWIATGLKPRSDEGASKRLRFWSGALVGVTFLQIGFGALVAGLRAGLTYNTWPLMDGVFIPDLSALTAMKPVWMNFVDSVLTVQFQHRMTAYLVLAVAFVLVGVALAHEARARCAVILVAVLSQVALGVATLVFNVPIELALAHQAGAFVVLWLSVVNWRRVQPQD